MAEKEQSKFPVICIYSQRRKTRQKRKTVFEKAMTKKYLD